MNDSINDFKRPSDWTEYDEAVRSALIQMAIHGRQLTEEERKEEHDRKLRELMNTNRSAL